MIKVDKLNSGGIYASYYDGSDGDKTLLIFQQTDVEGKIKILDRVSRDRTTNSVSVGWGGNICTCSEVWFCYSNSCYSIFKFDGEDIISHVITVIV